MHKYLTIFAISWQNEFTYRLNFILWRLRNILRFLMTYFLWAGIFVTSTQVFGYSQNQMFTYIFMVLVVQALVLAAPSSDNIGGEIANGDLSNYLIKPVSYLKYWLTRDLSSKVFNIIFAIIELTIIWVILHPPVFLPSSLVTNIGFLISCILAALIYFFVSVSARFVAFWTPESTWGVSFVILVLIDILSGGIFPLNILPNWLFNLLQLTPFPYLLYFPIAIFVGQITGFTMVRILIQSAIYLLVMFYVNRFLWKKGLLFYSSEGR